MTAGGSGFLPEPLFFLSGTAGEILCASFSRRGNEENQDCVSSEKIEKSALQRKSGNGRKTENFQKVYVDTDWGNQYNTFSEVFILRL